MGNHRLIAELAAVDIETANKEDLADVSGIVFDSAVPQERRAARIVEMVKNPYCFRVGEMGVKLEFTEGAPTLQDRLTDFLKRQTSGL